MRAAHIRTVFILVCSAAVIAAGVIIARQSARLAADERQHASDLTAVEQLRDALRRSPAATAAPPVPPEAAPAPAGAPSAVPDVAGIAARDATIERLQRELDEAKAGIARLDAQLASALQDKQAAAAVAGDTLQKREQEWRDRFSALEAQVETARAEADRARAALAAAASAPAETAGAGKGTAASFRAAELRHTVASLEDLDRRRDAYLASIIRRYRDITEQFRAMKSAIDSSRASGPPPFADVALGRIQNATSQAEDDLRRLNELNAQARQLESKLAGNGP